MKILQNESFRFLTCFLLEVTFAGVVMLPARGTDHTWDGGDGFWDLDPFKWNPLGVPGSNDRAIFDTDVSVNLSPAIAEVLRLKMLGGAELNLDGYDLLVSGGSISDINEMGVIIDGPSTNVVVPENSLLKAKQIIVQNGAGLDLSGGTMLMDSGAAIALISPGASVSGHGLIDIGVSSTIGGGGILKNNGFIHASFAILGDIGGASSGGIEISGVDSGFRYIDLDGDLESGQISISRNDYLQTNLPLNDPFSGRMTLSAGATLEIDRAWNFNGDLLANTQGVIPGTAGDPAFILGGALTQSGGTLTLEPIGSLVFSCPFTMSGGTIDNRGSIKFANTTTISGNFQTGSASHLQIDATTTFIFADWDWDGDDGADNVIDIGGSGTLNANLQFAGLDDVWNGQMNIAGGTLNVQGSLDNWGNEGAINIGGPPGLVGPSTITGDRLIQTAGTFHVLNPAEADMDAPSTWTGGALTIDGTLRFNQAATLNGAMISGFGTLEFHHNNQVNAPTTIAMTDGTTIFATGSATTLMVDLIVDNELTTVQVGAGFSGGGALINEGTLQLADGIVAADFTGVVENRGSLHLGESPGQVQIGAFEQSGAGVWHLEIGGVGANDFDRLSVTSIAVLDGILDLELIDGYVPVLDQTLNILLAPGGITGEFADILQPATMPAGLKFSIIYSSTQVKLQVVEASTISGDFDGDGDVDGRDFLVWQRNTNVGDLADWQANYGAGAFTATELASRVPEPGTGFLGLLATGVIAGRMKLHAAWAKRAG